jgi:hypothetical protein
MRNKNLPRIGADMSTRTADETKVLRFARDDNRFMKIPFHKYRFTDTDATGGT